MPWLPLPAGGDPAIVADAGAASALPAARTALLDMYAAASARCAAIPQPQTCVDNAFNMSAVFDVAPIAVPPTPPVQPGPLDLQAVVVHRTYPPRGILPLLAAHQERIPEGALAMDCLVVQDFYLDIIEAYSANGVATAAELLSVCPPFKPVPLLVELLISQMLLPAPPQLVFCYQSLLVRLVADCGSDIALCVSPGCRTDDHATSDFDWPVPVILVGACDTRFSCDTRCCLGPAWAAPRLLVFFQPWPSLVTSPCYARGRSPCLHEMIQSNVSPARVTNCDAPRACRAFGGCMKTLFRASTEMDALLMQRSAALLAFFVSNNNYSWPWASWARVLEVRPT